MLTVTEGAKQHLKKVLLVSTNDPDLGIRLTVDVSGEYGVALTGRHLVTTSWNTKVQRCCWWDTMWQNGLRS